MSPEPCKGVPTHALPVPWPERLPSLGFVTADIDFRLARLLRQARSGREPTARRYSLFKIDVERGHQAVFGYLIASPSTMPSNRLSVSLLTSEAATRRASSKVRLRARLRRVLRCLPDGQLEIVLKSPLTELSARHQKPALPAQHSPAHDVPRADRLCGFLEPGSMHRTEQSANRWR